MSAAAPPHLRPMSLTELVDLMTRFEQLEHRIDRAEAEAELVNFGRRPSLEERFVELQEDEEVEKELEELKDAAAKKQVDGDSA